MLLVGRVSTGPISTLFHYMGLSLESMPCHKFIERILHFGYNNNHFKLQKSLILSFPKFVVCLSTTGNLFAYVIEQLSFDFHRTSIEVLHLFLETNYSPKT